MGVTCSVKSYDQECTVNVVDANSSMNFKREKKKLKIKIGGTMEKVPEKAADWITLQRSSTDLIG